MKKNILLGVMLCTSPLIYSQATFASSGGNTISDKGSLTFTVGQLVYTSSHNDNGSIAQGVQQAFEFQLLSNSDVSPKNFTLLTYPNPTSDNFVVKLSDTSYNKLEYTLFDIQGKQIKTGGITKRETSIAIQDVSNGVYFLKVTKDKQLLKSPKIIKK
ncbi:T9SS type A sorting domain-containing protein [Polaribacter sp. R77954]|uniref:T9SS type A sorting domain-containing protein n=1 Tax=Polaribacter sp. R77954 TaxID=3093870 RepID=UPI0037CAA338